MQETRISDQLVRTINDFIIHFSGNSSLDAKAREYGVGIAVHKDMMKFIKHVEPVNSRIIWMYLENEDTN